jgi:type I restriction enzyme, S subunit
MEISADRLRGLRRYALEMSAGYLQAVFLEMFGDPVTNPMGWEVVKLKDISRQITDGTHKTPKYVQEGIPFISTVHVSEDGIDWDNAKHISQEEHNQLYRRCGPEVGDILYTKVGSVGFALPVTDPRPFSIFVQLALLKIQSEMVKTEFLVELLNMPTLRNKVLSRLTGATMKYIGIGDIGRMEVPLPPKHSQKVFCVVANQFERLRAQQREALRQAEHLFQGLLQAAFRGEV